MGARFRVEREGSGGEPIAHRDHNLQDAGDEHRQSTAGELVPHVVLISRCIDLTEFEIHREEQTGRGGEGAVEGVAVRRWAQACIELGHGRRRSATRRTG